VLGYNKAYDTVREIAKEYMPGMDWYAYGEYRDEPTMPVYSRKASTSQLNWQEVQAIDNPDSHEVHLIWRLPDGEKYITKSSIAKYCSPTGEFIPPEYATAKNQQPAPESYPMVAGPGAPQFIFELSSAPTQLALL